MTPKSHPQPIPAKLRKAELLFDLGKLFALEARDNPKDSGRLLKISRILTTRAYKVNIYNR